MHAGLSLRGLELSMPIDSSGETIAHHFGVDESIAKINHSLQAR